MQRNFILYGRQSAKGEFMKKMYLVNKSIVHLIDDIFWNLGFKTDNQAEKVVLQGVRSISSSGPGERGTADNSGGSWIHHRVEISQR
jgi:hypothetical protein